MVSEFGLKCIKNGHVHLMYIMESVINALRKVIKTYIQNQVTL